MKITSNPKDRLIIVSESGQHTIDLIHPGSYAVFLENISGELSVELLIEGVEVYIYGVYRGMKNEVEVQHEATVERIGEDKLFYLMSRGLSKEQAEGLLVNGFIEPVSREIPLEYSIELNRLINLEMAGSVG